MTAAERQHLASKWRCSDRTIKRWAAQGAPLSADDKRMRRWLSRRKNTPPRLALDAGLGVLERQVAMRRNGYLSPVQLAELGNEVDLQIVQSVGKLHSIAPELVGLSADAIEARLSAFEQEIYGRCLCMISGRVEPDLE